jgi:hypothetical protein
MLVSMTGFCTRQKTIKRAKAKMEKLTLKSAPKTDRKNDKEPNP